jgi:hypothetical protein
LQSLVKGLSSPGAAWLIATNLGAMVVVLAEAAAAASLTGDVGYAPGMPVFLRLLLTSRTAVCCGAARDARYARTDAVDL